MFFGQLQVFCKVAFRRGVCGQSVCLQLGFTAFKLVACNQAGGFKARKHGGQRNPEGRNHI